MSSSIGFSSVGGIRARLAVLGCLSLIVGSAHLGLELTARFAERHLDAYPWKQQAHLRLFSPASYIGRGAHRLFIVGASEAREALLPEELERAALGVTPYQGSFAGGTLEDTLVILSYIEAAYGRSAIPDALLLGITTRFIADINWEAYQRDPSPLFRSINKYSPYFGLDETRHPPALVPRSGFDSLRAWLALLRLQPERYQLCLVTIASALATRLDPRLVTWRRLWVHTRPAKYVHGKLASTVAIEDWLATPGNRWDAVHAWDPERDRGRVTRELQLLLDYTSRHSIELYVVNLPELSANRRLYKPGRYEAYVQVIRNALGGTPFLDLRTFLTDEEFYDDSHATWEGSIRVSRAVAAFILEQRQDALNARTEQ